MRTHRRTALLLAATLAVLAPAAMARQQMEVVIARDVADREPVEPGTIFPAGVGTLVAWIQLTDSQEGEVTFTWIHANGQEVITVPTGTAARWRTWSRRTIPADWTGEWTVQVTGSGGTGTATFTIGSE